jgi:sodium-type flagellar protein MotY
VSSEICAFLGFGMISLLLEQHREIHAGLRPVTLGRKPAGWLLTSLSKGQIGSFDCFDWDDSRRQALDPVAVFLLADEKITAIKVTGHADDQGRRRHNMKPSARRAASVTRYLVSKGVKPGLIQPRHYGESRPTIAKRSERARAANRRVEINLRRLR